METTQGLDRACYRCGVMSDHAQLQTCPLCLKTFCADCATKAAGRRFCSELCAMTYFYSDEDEENDRQTSDE